MPGRVLILAGTAEARRVCEACAGLDVLASRAGRVTKWQRLPVPVRTGGFGGAEGFRAALMDMTAVLDATHPFAATMSARTATLCAEGGVPYLRLTRAGFGDDPGWTRHPDAASCADALPPGARVFLTVGPGSVGPFVGRPLHLLCRAIEPPEPMAGVDWILGAPNVERTAEAILMAAHRITHLVTKDSGGPRAKLDAAADLGVAVHVIDRPPPGPGEETHDIDRAIAFVRAHAAHRG